MPSTAGALDVFSTYHTKRHITNKEVRERTNQPKVSASIRSRRMRLFGYIARRNSLSDHSRALKAVINGPARGWKRPLGRPRHTWIRSVKDDLRPFNPGPLTSCRKAQDRQQWRNLVEKATSSRIRYR